MQQSLFVRINRPHHPQKKQKCEKRCKTLAGSLVFVDIMLSGKLKYGMTIKQYARVLGSRGGKARAKILSAQKKQEIASLGGWARAESQKIARQIKTNFRYLEAIKEITPPPRVRSVKTLHNKLPDFYANNR